MNSTTNLCFLYEHHSLVWCTVKIEEKQETEPILDISILDSHSMCRRADLERAVCSCVLFNEHMQMTKVAVSILIINEAEYLFSDCVNCLSVCLLQSGIQIKDTFVSYSFGNQSIVYGVFRSSIIHCALDDCNNAREIIEELKNGALEVFSEIDFYLQEKYLTEC